MTLFFFLLFLRKFISKLSTTLSNGYLGSGNDEERSEMRYVMRIAEFSESSSFRTQIALSGYPGSTLLRALQTNRRRLSMRELKPRKKRALELFLRWAVQWVHTQDSIFPFFVFFALGDVAILPWPPCIGVMGNSLCSSGILTPNPNELLPHYYTFNEHIRNCVFFFPLVFSFQTSPHFYRLFLFLFAKDFNSSVNSTMS